MYHFIFTLSLAAIMVLPLTGCDDDSTSLPASTLGERITTTTITLDSGVRSGVSNWRIWGTGSLHVAPVYTAPLADCETLVCYTLDINGTPTAQIAHLDGDDALLRTYTLTAGLECRGLASEPDGHFAALLWDDASDRIYVTRFDSTGTELWSEELTNADNRPDDFGIGDSRLEFGNGTYGAYYHVHSDSGHEGDTLKWVTTEGVESTGWGWGCSHSMSNLLRYNDALGDFMPACVTDCYPGTSGDFAANSIGGIYLNHNTGPVIQVDAGCNGSVAGELGSAAIAPQGWKLIFNAHRNGAKPGQNSYDPATMNQDIGWASIGDGYTYDDVVWLTKTSDINEADATVARWTPAGSDEELYVVGWAETSTPYVYKLGVADATGRLVEAPLDITATARWGRRDDPMRRHCNGDIVWAWFDAPGDTTLNFARIESGNSCTCDK